MAQDSTGALLRICNHCKQIFPLQVCLAAHALDARRVSMGAQEKCLNMLKQRYVQQACSQSEVQKICGVLTNYVSLVASLLLVARLGAPSSVLVTKGVRKKQAKTQSFLSIVTSQVSGAEICNSIVLAWWSTSRSAVFALLPLVAFLFIVVRHLLLVASCF